MIADLTGKKLILKKNFNEASLMGGAAVCFETDLDYEVKHIDVEKEYLPTENQYLQDRLKAWLLYREKINSKKEIGAF